MKGEETEGKLMMTGQRPSDIDRLSELPDCVLLHIMNFMDTKYAVQTCVLSKRWKDLCKRLTNLSFNSLNYYSLSISSKFVSWVMSARDDSISLHSLKFSFLGFTHAKQLNRIVEYAALHNVQWLSIQTNVKFEPNFELCPFIFSCQSLKFLSLSINCGRNMIKLPKSLHLPALESLHLVNVPFTAGDNDCVEPFSTCNMLNTLVVQYCDLNNDAEVLHISNSNLSCLTIDISYRCKETYKVALSTPNLCSLTLLGCCINFQLSSICNLSLLEEASIGIIGLFNLSWLEVLTNVKIMTLSVATVDAILNVLSKPVSEKTQPPCFVRLESLQVKKNQYPRKTKEEVTRVVEYLLQNSTSGVDVINYRKLCAFLALQALDEEF